MTLYIDYKSPSVQFSYDMNNNTLFKKDARNYINVLSIDQLNTLDSTSLLDIYLSKSNVVEPHYHQNAAELVYCISGAAVVSLINPFTNELLHFPIKPGQVANVPQGWWHYEMASVDDTHLLAIFNAPTPEVILGSDLLRLTPASVLAHTYCLNEAEVKQTLAPIKKSVFIGPPADCKLVENATIGNMAGKKAAKPNSQAREWFVPESEEPEQTEAFQTPEEIYAGASAGQPYPAYGYAGETERQPQYVPYGEDPSAAQKAFQAYTSAYPAFAQLPYAPYGNGPFAQPPSYAPFPGDPNRQPFPGFGAAEAATQPFFGQPVEEWTRQTAAGQPQEPFAQPAYAPQPWPPGYVPSQPYAYFR
ncbi:hypothetical protein GCM10020370_08030 [Paenibacillus hodogayensis]